MRVDEVAPDVFRLSLSVPEMNIQFNQFLVRDDEPLLFHTGMRNIFPQVREAVSRLIDPTTLRWISFSHFEADECGSLNEWLDTAPQATALTSFVGANVNLNDFASRPARAMNDNEVFSTGKHRFRFLSTPHVPHCWEAALLYDETDSTLFCSDLFFHWGDAEPTTESDVVERFKKGLIADQQGPFANAYPYTPLTDATLERLAALHPKTIALMHGSTFIGDGEQALKDLAVVLREVLA
ncbi:MAG: MBL fold metallo-hydrolase [Pyrinomonadaceae bacterium]